MSPLVENSAEWKTTFRDQLAESARQKIKENIIPRGKFRLVGNDPYLMCMECCNMHVYLLTFCF